MRARRSWIGWGIVMGLMGSPVWSAEPDSDAVRQLMKKYEQETGAEKPPPVPKPQPKLVPKPQPKPAPAVDHDREAWRSAEKCGTAACFRAYLEEYPKGRYARMARARLEPMPKPSTPAPAESGVVPEMVRIKGGCFQMGSPETEEGRGNDERQHAVCVKDFEIGKYEVTVGEFRRFVEATGYRTDAEWNAGGKEGCFISYLDGGEWKYDYRAGYSWRNPNFSQGNNHPVVCVSWHDVVAYAEWLSKQAKRTYRFPTEAEWEYAARAGTTMVRYWGDDPDRACVYANVADRMAKRTFPDWSVHDCSDGQTYTAPVGSYEANDWGLRDILGNVWEWTCSLYDKDYGGAEQKCSNKDTSSPLAVRGGSWFNFPAWVRSANRGGIDPTFRDIFQGFRLARSL